MFNWFKSRSNPNGQLEEVVSGIAVLIDDTPQFRHAAAEATGQLSAETVSSLKERFHNPPEAPDGFKPDQRGLGGWLSAWQFAIFELYYNLGEAALPVLREVAYGEYDWTQGNAIEVLCRLAADGVDRQPILDELKQRFPSLRFEAQLYAAGPLIAQAEDNQAVAEIVEELMSLDEFREAVEELTDEGDGDPDNLSKTELHGTVTKIEELDEQVLNKHVVGAVHVEGLSYFSFEESSGAARIAITDDTRVQRIAGAGPIAIGFDEIPVGGRVALGFYSFTQQTSPVTVYPDSLTLLET